MVGLLAVPVLLFAGCSDSGDSDDGGSDTTSDPGDVRSGDPHTASVVLESGNQAAFPIECDLEPHEMDGDQVLFSASSTEGSPAELVVVQYAPESRDGEAVIRASDAETDEVRWLAEGTDPVDAELRVDGDTIEGSGLFYEGGDLSGEGIVGELTVNC